MDVLPGISSNTLMASHLATWSKTKRRHQPRMMASSTMIMGARLSRDQRVRAALRQLDNNGTNNDTKSDTNNDTTTTTTATTATTATRSNKRPRLNPPTPPAGVTTNISFTAKYVAGRGGGLYATRPIKRGQIICSEKPLLTVQTPLNEKCNYICESCHVPLGDLQLQVKHATCGEFPSCTLPMVMLTSSPIFSPPEKVSVCINQCGVGWCSSKCRASSEEVHQMLCPHAHSINRAFYEDALENNHTFLLVGRVLAEIVVVLQCDTKSSEQVLESGCYLRWWREYVHPLWWDIVPMRAVVVEEKSDDEGGDEGADDDDDDDDDVGPTPAMLQVHKDTLRADCARSRDLLLEIVRPMWSKLNTSIVLEDYFTLESFGEIAGMLTTNTMGITMASPIQQYFENFVKKEKREKMKKKKKSHASSSSSSSSSSDDNTLQPVLSALGKAALIWQEDKTFFNVDSTTTKNLDVYFPSIEGTGLYPLLSFLNHDCFPNCSTEHLDSSNIMSLIALRDIGIYEELSITYIPSELEREERIDLLLEYGFVCKCAKCCIDIFLHC